MSSEGSISSTISQFGLYRTIDARTEEFLKLSKKRQIKQGCVCAAISTAATVIIVVTIILIYEYNVVAEAKRTSSKLNWLDLMNNSINDVILHERFNKANIYIDKNTLKLLPIVLRALNNHRYAEKITEESTSPYPPLATSSTDDIDYTKNIFADTRNWMKMPNSRLCTIEYKTSPIVYFKNPTRNIDYFTKIRKIRDYERILNYVDKMISDRNSLGTTWPMNDHTEYPLKLTTPMKKDNIQRKKVTQKSSTSETLIKDKKQYCKCTHNIGELMNKLLKNIQNLLTYLSGSNVKETINQCRPAAESKQLKSSTDKLTSTSQKMIESKQNFQFELTTASLYKNFLNKHKYTVDFTNTFERQRGYTLNAIKNIMKPIFNKQKNFALKFPSNEDFSTTNSYVMPFETNILLKETSTESFPKYTVNIKTPTNIATTVADYILQTRTYEESPESKSTFADTNFSKKKEYTETTENIASDLNKLDADSLALIKSKIIPERINDSHEKSSEYLFKGAKRNQKIYTNFGQMRKLGNLITNDHNKTTKSRNLYRFSSNFNTISKSTTAKVKLTTLHTESLTSTNKPTTKPMNKSLVVKDKSGSQNMNISFFESNTLKIQQNRNNSITLKEETAKILHNNISNEALRHMEEAIKILNNDTTINYVEQLTSTLDDSNQWETVKLEESIASSKSMIPNSKSTYLEMQRIGWKHDDYHDYDHYTYD